MYNFISLFLARMACSVSETQRMERNGRGTAGRGGERGEMTVDTDIQSRNIDLLRPMLGKRSSNALATLPLYVCRTLLAP